MRRIAPAEAFELMKKGAPYVDVRTEEEFAAGHPEGAYNVPIAAADFVHTMLGAFDKTAPIVLGCRSGHRSLVAARDLEAEGFTQVFEQRAGWDGERDAFGRVTLQGWRKAGLPSTTGSGDERSHERLKEKTG